jgi:phosphomannomutase
VALIKSISGIRGTIGGKPDETLSPLDIVKFVSAYGIWVKDNQRNHKVVVGRDARISGELISHIVISALNALGIDVIDLNLSTTPTVEMAVVWENAAGGIMITASHNPREWNALKLLNHLGEFISAEDGERILDMASREDFIYSSVDKLGTTYFNNTYIQKHIDKVINHPLVEVDSINNKNYKVVVDAINSSGAVAVPELLKALGVEQVTLLNGEMNGKFAHNPEPLPENLVVLSSTVIKTKADFGIAVDPDVDRLCFVCEDGSMFGEEYTLVAVADYVLSRKNGNTVSNMSSTKALKEITLKHGGQYFPSAVGEVNVVRKMKEVNAVVGGEGNGGIIIPDLHYGRDALIGIALFLTALSKEKNGIRSFRKRYPDYFISKNKVELQKGVNVAEIFTKIRTKYKNHPTNTDDGLKIEFDNDWVHLRTSNTEPIIRIYAESNFETTARNIAQRLMHDIKEFI